MDSKYSFSLEIRIEAANLFDAGFGFSAVATHLGLSRETVRSWSDKHSQGRLLDSVLMGYRSYSQQIKVAAVEKFLSGTPKSVVVAEFEISSRSLFDNWVRIYRTAGPAGLAVGKRGRPPKNSRPETLEERLAFLEMENEILKKWVALAQEEDRRLSGL
jgi:transposase-like protein